MVAEVQSCLFVIVTCQTIAKFSGPNAGQTIGLQAERCFILRHFGLNSFQIRDSTENLVARLIITGVLNMTYLSRTWQPLRRIFPLKCAYVVAGSLLTF